MKVEDLPSLTIESIEQDSRGNIVRGHFDRLEGVSESGWFRVNPNRFIVAYLGQVDTSTRAATVVLSEDEVCGLSIGHQMPWFNGGWPIPLVQAIIDESHVWNSAVFRKSNAVHFRCGAKVGWQKEGTQLLDGAVVIRHEADGWDHEHCNICDARIDADNPQAFTTADGVWWLCSACYDRFGKTHDVSFQLVV